MPADRPGELEDETGHGDDATAPAPEAAPSAALTDAEMLVRVPMTRGNIPNQPDYLLAVIMSLARITSEADLTRWQEVNQGIYGSGNGAGIAPTTTAGVLKAIANRRTQIKHDTA
jgi:hypothetical protein